MDNQIITMLWILVSICYTGFGYLITMNMIQKGGNPSRNTRFFTIILWPFMGLLAILAQKTDKH